MLVHVHVLLAHLVDDVLVHDRRSADGAVRVRRVDVEASKSFVTSPTSPSHVSSGWSTVRIRSKSSRCCHMSNCCGTVPRRGSSRPVEDRDLAELVALVVDVVDERLQRRDAQPAGHEQDVVALHLLEREAAAERPRSPTMSPHCFWCSAPVTSPALRTHSSMKPCLDGAEEIEIGASPTPKIESSTNWPVELERLAHRPRR